MLNRKLTGKEIMSLSRYLIVTFGLFIFIFLYETLIHDFVLMRMYEETIHVWRNYSEMQANMPVAICLQLALSAWITFVFFKFYKQGGIKSGLWFGLFFGIFAGILTASWYLWLPVPANLGIGWFIAAVGEGIGGGYILGLLSKSFGKKNIQL